MNDVDNELIEYELELKEAIKKRKAFENMLAEANNPWGYSAPAMESKSAAMAMLSTKTGLYARIPLTCKADNCPYSNTCVLLQNDLAPYGEKCVIETTLIERSLEGYARDFDLNPDTSYTDFTIVKELINTDIMMERAQALLSQEGIAIEEVYAGSNDANENFYRKEISKALELYERHSKMRDRLLGNMVATRREKMRLKVADEKSYADMLAESLNAEFIIDEKPEGL